jgi:flagellar motility protein MotE (MotC chaperone)
MSRIPRILPLVAIAIGGVLALKVVSNLDGAPAFLQEARAFAEDLAPGEAAKKAGKLPKKGDKAPVAKPDAAPAPDPLGGPPPAATAAADAAVPAAAQVALTPICAPSAAELAKEAGLSPAELRVLQSLQSRRGELDSRSQAMDTQMALLAAAELKVDAKLKTLASLKGELQGMVGQADQKTDAEIARLVTVYSAMKPADAAAVMTQLDDRVRVPVAGKMKERALAAILGKMPPVEAKKLTEKLAARFSSQGVAEKIAQADAPTPAAPAKAGAAATPPKPASAPPRKRTPKAAHRPSPKPAAKPDAKSAPPPAAKPAALKPAAASLPPAKVN